MLLLLMFVVQNKRFFSTNNENHNIDTRQRNNLYLPQANLTIYQDGAYYSGIKFLIIYPWRLRMMLVTKKSSNCSEKKNLYPYSFCTMEEYFCQSWIMYCITRFLIIVIHWFKIVSVCIMYVFIDCTFWVITFPCINLICLIYVL